MRTERNKRKKLLVCLRAEQQYRGGKKGMCEKYRNERERKREMNQIRY